MPIKITSAELKEERSLRRLIDDQEIALSGKFLRAVTKSKAALSLSKVERLLEDTQLNLILDETNNIYEDVVNAMLLALLLSGEREAIKIAQKVAFKISLNKDDVSISNFIQRERTRITSIFSTGQKDAITEALLDGIKRGNTTRQQAKAVRDSIGMTVGQVKAAGTYRDALEKRSASVLNRALRDKSFDSAIRRSIQRKENIEKSKINAMMKRYRENQLKDRAEAIAQTEATKAIHEGADIMFKQAIASGALSVVQIIRTWITRQDGKVRDSHDGMHGQKRGINEVFISDAGNALRFPHDSLAPLSEIIRCRCVLIIMID